MGALTVLARLMNTVAEMTARLDWLAEHGLKNWVEELAALHALQVQAQALLDMVMRGAAELGYTPTSPREAAEALLAENLITDKDYQLIRSIIGFRNILVHEYMGVDMDLVRRIIEDKEYRRVTILAARLLEEFSRKGIDP